MNISDINHKLFMERKTVKKNMRFKPTIIQMLEEISEGNQAKKLEELIYKYWLENIQDIKIKKAIKQSKIKGGAVIELINKTGRRSINGD